MTADPFSQQTSELPTPALVVDEAALDDNIAAMADALPGTRLRPHVKAFKSTDLARRLARAGHTGFCCATLREIDGMLSAGLGEDLLLANESVDVARLRATAELAASTGGRVTVAVDSPTTVAAAAEAGIAEVLIDVNVGLPRCGCAPEQAGPLADQARSLGLGVRGVMGYEGHLMMVEDPAEKSAQVATSMAQLAEAAAAVGGDIVSAGGTGTFNVNSVATEIQAGSYTLMDTQYSSIDLPFRQALWVEATIISVGPDNKWVVADAGLKALGMDHGDPTWPGGKVWFCSDEHITLGPSDDVRASIAVGDRIRLAPAHVDPTIAKHERMWLMPADGGDPIEWSIDLRHW